MAHSPRFEAAMKSFMGHLEGTHKAAHTIESYRSDLGTFRDFLERDHEQGETPLALSELHPKDLEHFHAYLEARGLKVNTRRRKLLTVRKFLAYLNRRKKLSAEGLLKIPAPAKLERVPEVTPWKELIARIQTLPEVTALDLRNRALLWTLAETGAQVAEIGKLRVGCLHWEDESKPWIQFEGKNARRVPVSLELAQAIQRVRPIAKDHEPLFLGYNRFGPLGGAVSPRGIELLVRALAERLGNESLVPRTFRHSAAVGWFQAGVHRDEIRRRLGLRTDYAFRVYEPLFESKKETFL